MTTAAPHASPHGSCVTFGPFCLSAAERLLTKDGEPVEIGGRSFDLLAVLAEQPGRVVSKRELLKRVWSDVVVEDGSLRFHMAGLRRALGDGENGARYIATQVGVGYAFVAPVERAPLPSPDTFTPSAGGRSNLGVSEGSGNLPARVPRVLGRENDLAVLSERLARWPLFTIVGPAGVGKTTLAVELAYRLAPEFDDSITFVDFSLLDDPALIAQVIAGAMMITVQGDDPLAVILGHIRDKKVLLVLDNCEHVIDAVAATAERIVAAAPSARIVATSREPMRIRGEHVHRLDAHAYPREPACLSLEQLLAYPAVELFCERAVAAGYSREIDEHAARLIAAMCKRLDGVALAIELAAVRVATHGLEATTRLLDERFSLGWQGHRNALPRQQTLQAMLDWSYGLLSPTEQLTLTRLAVFVGLFSIDAAIRVVADESLHADDVAAALDGLVSKSLVVAQPTSGAATYRLLEMTRSYAREKLQASDEDRARSAAHRHATYYLTEIDSAAVDDAESLLDARGLREQLGNIRSALEWTFGPDGEPQLAARLASASARVFLTLSSLIECRMWCARAIAALPDELAGTAIELELQAGLGTALMFTRGNSLGSGAALSRALELASALDDKWNQLRLLGRLHIFHERIGEYGVALAYAERAVSLAEELGEPEALAIAYSLSGISHHLAGDQVRARRDLEFSLENSGPSLRRSTIHYGFDHRNRSAIALSRTLWLIGSPERALRLAKKTVREAAALDHAVTHCIALLWSFSVHLWAEQFDDAERDLETFTACAEINALGPYIAAAGGLHAELELQSGRATDASAALEESLSRLRVARYELLTTPFSLALARALLDDGRLDEARDLIRGTMQRCADNGEEVLLPELLRTEASILTAAGDQDLAQARLTSAIAVAEKQGAAGWARRALADLDALNAR